MIDHTPDEGSVLTDVANEIARQDQTHPAGYPPTRDGIRLGLAAADDECFEAWQAWQDRKGGRGWLSPAGQWAQVRIEVIQAAAVLLRIAREIGKE